MHRLRKEVHTRGEVIEPRTRSSPPSLRGHSGVVVTALSVASAAILLAIVVVFAAQEPVLGSELIKASAFAGSVIQASFIGRIGCAVMN